MFSSAFVLLALSASALGTVYVTSPTASTTFSGGKQATISWQDDGQAPSLKDFGVAKVSIYVGNAQQQTSLQLITNNVDVSTTGSIQFTPDPAIGPNSKEYFIRFESVNAKDPKQPQFPALAFSSKFSMDNMSGSFSPAVQAQIDGQSTAPIGGATSAPAAQSSAPATTTKGSSATTSASRAASSATTSSNPNGATSISVVSTKVLLALVAVLAIALR